MLHSRFLPLILLYLCSRMEPQNYTPCSEWGFIRPVSQNLLEDTKMYKNALSAHEHFLHPWTVVPTEKERAGRENGSVCVSGAEKGSESDVK